MLKIYVHIMALTEKEWDPETWDEGIYKDMCEGLKPWMLLNNGGCRNQSFPSLENSILPLPGEDEHLPELNACNIMLILLGIFSTDPSNFSAD